MMVMEEFSATATVERGTFRVVPRQAQLVLRLFLRAWIMPRSPTNMRTMVAR